MYHIKHFTIKWIKILVILSFQEKKDLPIYRSLHPP